MRRKFGQHFLHDANLVERIVQSAFLSEEDLVIEVGVGRGALTRCLALRAGQVIGFEIDPFLYKEARKKLADYANVSLVCEDFLRVKLEEFLRPYRSMRVKCVSSIPYAISTPLLFHLVGSNVPWQTLVLLVQREFGEKMYRFPPQGRGSLLALAVHLLFRVEKLFVIPSWSFTPPPRVVSLLVRLIPREDRIGQEQYVTLMQWGRFFFSTPRKSMGTLLARKLASRSEAEELLTGLGISPLLRPEELDRNEWLTLGAALSLYPPQARSREDATFPSRTSGDGENEGSKSHVREDAQVERVENGEVPGKTEACHSQKPEEEHLSHRPKGEPIRGKEGKGSDPCH